MKATDFRAVAVFCSFCTAAVLQPVPAKSDPAQLLRAPGGIAEHNKRKGAFRFNQDTVAGEAGLFFFNALGGQNTSGLIEYRELPRCSGNSATKRKVYHHTPGSEKYDLIFFDGANLEQKKKAKHLKAKAVPYKPALTFDKNGDLEDAQVLARMLKIECLPTRFRFVYLDNQRYMEFRTGERAWDEKR